MKYYAGIGSRETPDDILKYMTFIAHHLDEEYILRSGGADGADMAFENGVTNDNKEIYLPFKNFNKNKSSLYEVTDEAIEFTSKYHPNWKNLKRVARLMMARNAYQVLGKDLKTPVDFVLCWTPDGCVSPKSRSKATGGTGQAISIAYDYKIPIINMKSLIWKEELLSII